MSNNTKLATAPQTATNYILKATSTTLGNSLAYDDGTGIAIGDTTASGFKFKVNGTTSLTGALSGTSATFTTNQNASTWVKVANSDAGSGAAAGFLIANNGGDLGAISLLSSTNSPSNALFIRTLSTNPLVLGSNSGQHLTLASTGAATFSSSVTAGGRVLASGGSTNAFSGSNNSASEATLYVNNANAAGFGVYSAGGINYFGGNVGIGTTSNITSKLVVDGKLSIGNGWGTSGATLDIIADATGANGVTLDVSYWSGTYGPLIMKTNNTERMRITSGGEFIVNSTTISNGAKAGIYFSDATNNGLILRETTNNASVGYLLFNSAGTQTGSIIRNGSSNAVLYQTTSDYRLKEDLKDFNGLDLVSKIKTYNFKWKSCNERMIGVLAHELKEVLPFAVSGEKDELYEDGSSKYQGVDYSMIVSTLVKAIQEQQAQIEELKALIAAK